MPNPALLLCDSDALIQFFIADDLRPLQSLRTQFGIQPVIALEVDLELRWLAKHKDRFVSTLDKALRTGTLAKLDQATFQSCLGTATPGTSWSTFQSLGTKYYGYVQRGEAYTHAAAVTLGMPAMTNDGNAVRVLEGQMLSVAVPTLRSFDLFSFALEFGVLQIKECEDIRSELLANGEGLPGPFANKSFEDGVKKFPCRLRHSNAPDASCAPPTKYYEPLTIIPT
jgi:hypothetical protein